MLAHTLPPFRRCPMKEHQLGLEMHWRTTEPPEQCCLTCVLSKQMVCWLSRLLGLVPTPGKTETKVSKGKSEACWIDMPQEVQACNKPLPYDARRAKVDRSGALRAWFRMKHWKSSFGWL